MKDLFNDMSRFKIEKLTPRTNPVRESTFTKPLRDGTEQIHSGARDEWEEVKVRWEYDETAWHIITDPPSREPPELFDYFVTGFTILGCTVPLLGAFITAFVFALQLWGLPLTITGLIVLVVGIAVVCTRAQGEKLKPMISREVVISPTQVRIGNSTHELISPESSTTPLIVIPGQLTFLRAFTQRWFTVSVAGGAEGWSYGSIDILVPPGEEIEAEQLARWFHEAYEKRRRSMRSAEEEIEEEE